MQTFIPKKQIYYFTWHCFAPYVLLAYFLSIPSTAEPSWYKINQTIHKFKIATNWLNLSFAMYDFIINFFQSGLLCSSAIELKGTPRQILVKIESIMIVVLVLQWFLPFREGTLIVRFMMGALINLDIKYSNLYFRSLIRPIETYVLKKYPEQENMKLLGFQLCMRQYIAFGVGWILQGIMAMSYPSQEMLNKLRIYDDSVLWNLLISMPTVFIAIRLINIQLSFNYDELKTCKQNEGEYFLANMFKKAYVEEVIDMYNNKQLFDEEQQYEIVNFKSQKIYQIILHSSGTMMLVLYAQKLSDENINLLLHRYIILFGILMTLTNFYSTKLFHKIPYTVTYKMSIAASLVSQFSLILSNQLQNYYFILLSSILVIISNNLGLFTFTGGFNYYIDDYMGQQITQSLTLIVLIGSQFFTSPLIQGSIVMGVLGIYVWRQVGDSLSKVQDEEEDTAQLIE